MEKSNKNILFLFLLLFTLSFDLTAQIKDVPVVKLFEKEYYKYDIKPHESIYSICKKFNVTEAELLSMNPFIIEGLKAGQTLMIPVKISKVSTDKELVIDKDKTTFKAPSSNNKPVISTRISAERARITVILPFAKATGSNSNDKYTEFYEGFLLAVDSLKSLGLSFEVQALESGNDTEAINHAIITGKLNETDYCIGGTTSEQISVLAQWAKSNQKILIAPFSSHIPEMENNPYIFQTITPHNYIYDQLAEYYVRHIENSNVIFLNNANDDSDIGTLLIPRIKKELQKKGISFKEVTNDESLESLSNALVEGRKNNIIPTPLTINETNQLVTRLGAYAKANPQKPIELFGYPDWQAMSKSYQKRLYELNTRIYSNFYADAQKQNVRNFQILYNQTFGKNMLNSYPKYGMMGYDIAAYFIPRMVFEKSENQERTPAIAPVQNGFRFSSRNPLGGSLNQVFYIIHYTPDNTVEVLQLK